MARALLLVALAAGAAALPQRLRASASPAKTAAHDHPRRAAPSLAALDASLGDLTGILNFNQALFKGFPSLRGARDRAAADIDAPLVRAGGGAAAPAAASRGRRSTLKDAPSIIRISRSTSSSPSPVFAANALHSAHALPPWT